MRPETPPIDGSVWSNGLHLVEKAPALGLSFYSSAVVPGRLDGQSQTGPAGASARRSGGATGEQTETAHSAVDGLSGASGLSRARLVVGFHYGSDHGRSDGEDADDGG